MVKSDKLKNKLPVKIRAKKISGGNKSLYLDIYSNGVRKKEYLKLYLIPEKTDEAIEINKNTLKLAESIMVKRIASLQIDRNPFTDTVIKETAIPFADYMESEIDKIKLIRSSNYIRRYNSGIAWVRRYDSKTALGEVNKKWIQGFIKFMSITPGKYGKILNQNTVHEYLIYIANILNNAVREGLIQSNPTKKLSVADRPKKYESKRDYLTEDEIKKLIKVPSPKSYNNIRGAFLFACFSGLRYSDIKQLKWKDIKESSDGVSIVKKLQKTQTMLNLPIGKKAVSFLPCRGDSNTLVFSLPKSMVTVEAYIKVWSEFAEIDKHVTFHTSRHSYAVNILAKGGDIYTLSKLLGHKRVLTTQIYAEVLDENKKKTVELLDGD